MKSTLIKDTTKEERIALIKEWIPDDDGLEDCGIDLWEMYDPYIRGEKEIAECNAAFHAEYFTEDSSKDKNRTQSCGMGGRGFGFR